MIESASAVEKSQNQHLNFFRFYGENLDAKFLENNITRALLICLQYDGIFFKEFIQMVLGEKKDKIADLFGLVEKDERFEFDLQIDMESIPKDNFENVYAIAITQEKLDTSKFHSLKSVTYPDKKNITDAIISYRDTLLIIEVKKTNEDCLQQLWEQTSKFDQTKVVPVSISWKSIVSLMENLINFEISMELNPVYLRNFLEFVEPQFPDWFDAKPLKNISFPEDAYSKEGKQFKARMIQAIQKSNQTLLGYSSRLGIGVDFGWASEILIAPSINEKGEKLIQFSIYPASTKEQGYYVFPKGKTIHRNLQLPFDKGFVPVKVFKSIAFRHFNRFITSINFEDSDLQKESHKKENFEKYAGKKSRDQWNDVEAFLDAIFKAGFDWRRKCGWERQFINSNRSYFVMTLTYEVYLDIPYEGIQNLDKTDQDVDRLGKLIDTVANTFYGLF